MVIYALDRKLGRAVYRKVDGEIRNEGRQWRNKRKLDKQDEANK